MELRVAVMKERAIEQPESSRFSTREPVINPHAIGKPYAGRDSAVSTDATDDMKGPNIPIVRHHMTGEKYAFGRQLYRWNSPWNLPQTYMHRPDVRIEPLTEPTVTPKWQQSKEFEMLGNYGSATSEFKTTYAGILMNNPEAVFPDPNNPLLKQLQASKAKRANTTSTLVTADAERQKEARSTKKIENKKPKFKVCHITGAVTPYKEFVPAPELKDTFVAPRSSLVEKSTASIAGAFETPTCNPLSNEPAAWADGVWAETPLGIIAADEREFRKQFQLEKTPKPAPPKQAGIAYEPSKSTTARRQRERKQKVSRDIRLVRDLL